ARRLVDAAAALSGYASCDERAEVAKEAYLSAFTYGDAFRDLLRDTGSPRGYARVCGAPFLWWGIDPADALAAAPAHARRLAAPLADRYGVAEDDLLLFYSGAKGFHLGLPTALWQPGPSAEFNRVARHFAEAAAGRAGVTIDASVYDKVRAFRAPNSRHPRT